MRCFVAAATSSSGQRDFRPSPWRAGTAAAAPGPGVDCNTTPFQTFPVHHWGQWRFRFFGQKNLTAQRPGLPLGTNIEGTWAHALNFFTNWLFRLTREKVDFRQNFGIFLRASGPRYSHQIFITYDPWGSPYDAIKILTLTPKIFEKLGKNFFGGGGPRGPWVQNFRGWPQTQDGIS